MLTSDRIEPRPATKALAAGTSRPSRIEDHAAQIAKIVAQEQQTETLRNQIEEIEKRPDTIGHLAHPIHMHLEEEDEALTLQKLALEDLLMWETPTTIREAFLMMLLCGHRTENNGEKEDAAVRQLVNTITVFLEGQSGTTAKELGLESFRPAKPDWSGEMLRGRAERLINRAAAEPCVEAAS